MHTLRYLPFILGFLALACHRSEPTSQLKRQAQPNNDDVKVARVIDGSNMLYVLVTNGKGYRIDCDKVLKRKEIIESVGFPFEAINDERPISINSEAYEKLKVDEQPRITCEPGEKVLYKAELDGRSKYFFSEPSLSSTRLYMFGCKRLLDAMGFEATQANTVEPDMIDELGIFSVDNQDDIHCLQGFAVDAKLAWTHGDTETLTVAVGQEIGPKVFAATKPDQSAAQVKVLPTEGECSWIKTISTSDSVILSGKVPATFYNRSCKISVQAEAGTIFSDTKILTIVTDKTVPQITSDCPPSVLLLDPSQTVACRVSANLGMVSVLPSTSEDCQKLVNLNPTNGQLQFMAGSASPRDCIVSVNADLNGVTSATLSLQVSVRRCPDGFLFIPGDVDYGNRPFCVMKYEAKNLGNTPVAVASGLPWGEISLSQARSACSSLGSGYALIKSIEWTALAANLAAQNKNWTGGAVGSGTLVRGFSSMDYTNSRWCAADSDDKPFMSDSCIGVSSAADPATRRTHYLSTGQVIWDLSGNVQEIVDDSITMDKPAQSFKEYPEVKGSATVPLKSMIPVQKLWWNTAWNSNSGIGVLHGSGDGLPVVFLRGGYAGRDRGIFNLNLSYPLESRYPDIGFRCAYHPEQN